MLVNNLVKTWVRTPYEWRYYPPVFIAVAYDSQT